MMPSNGCSWIGEIWACLQIYLGDGGVGLCFRYQLQNLKTVVAWAEMSVC
jgi:hypothetical protein